LFASFWFKSCQTWHHCAFTNTPLDTHSGRHAATWSTQPTRCRLGLGLWGYIQWQIHTGSIYLGPPHVATNQLGKQTMAPYLMPLTTRCTQSDTNHRNPSHGMQWCLSGHSKLQYILMILYSDQALWQGKEFVPGLVEDVYSGQSKVFGILMLLWFLSNYLSNYPKAYPTTPTLMVYCDNQGVLDHILWLLVNKPIQPWDTTANKYDIYIAIWLALHCGTWWRFMLCLACWPW